MDRQKFLNLLNNDIDLFISNYLIDGNLDGLSGVDDVSVYITDCFPYLSTFYLILSNFDSIESKKFIERHGSKLEEETNLLKARLGHLLYHKNEVDLIKQKLEDSEKENEAKRILIQLLNDDISILKTDNRLQEQKIIELQDENNELVRKISELELRLKEILHSSAPDYYPVNNNNNEDRDCDALVTSSDLIDMGTSVLWRAYNLGSENVLEDGDYYSWGALNNAEYFGKSVWGYKQVIKKSISGLSDCDAARSILGDGYRIPTVQEWKELLAICAYKPQKITFKGRNFVKLVSTKTNNTLLLPFIGHMEADICDNRLAQYWTSEQDTGKSSFIFQFSNSGWDVIPASKWFGMSIRPVYDSTCKPKIQTSVDRMNSIIQAGTLLAASQAVPNVVGQALAPALSIALRKHINPSNGSYRKYPKKNEINESNIFNYLIKDCIPYGKSVFEGDLVRDIELDLNKLNQILKEYYSLQPILFGSIASKRLKDLKALILSKLSR